MGSTPAEGVAFYDMVSQILVPVQGTQVNGTVCTVLVQGTILFVSGKFTIVGMNMNGLATYDLVQRTWNLSGLQALQPASSASVVMQSLTMMMSLPLTLSSLHPLTTQPLTWKLMPL